MDLGEPRRQRHAAHRLGHLPTISEGSGELQQIDCHSSAGEQPPSHGPREQVSGVHHHPRSGYGEQHVPHSHHLRDGPVEPQLPHQHSVETTSLDFGDERRRHRHASSRGRKDDDEPKRHHHTHRKKRDAIYQHATALHQRVPGEAPKVLQDGVREEEWRVFHNRHDITNKGEETIAVKVADKAKEVAGKAFGTVSSMFA